MASKESGFGCVFQEDPPKTLECPICLHTMREPHVISCCGHHFCRLCIERVREDGKPCPLCSQAHFTLFHHKGVEREVKALRVYCTHKALGCEWAGELGALEEHLTCPGLAGRGAPAQPAEVCAYVEVECVYQCGERQQRRFIRKHEAETCVRRPIEAQMAGVSSRLDKLNAENQLLRTELDAANVKITRAKEEFAAEVEQMREKYRALEAANRILRTDLERMRAEQAKKVKQVNKARSDNQALRDDFERLRREHERRLNKSEANIQALRVEMKSEIARLKEDVGRRDIVSRTELAQVRDKSRAELEHLREIHEKQWTVTARQCDLLESQLSPSGMHLFTVINFEHLKKNGIAWHSTFLSHPRGYKLRVEVLPGGWGGGRDSYVSMYVRVIHGPYDDTLKWPFLATVLIRAFDRPTNKWKTLWTLTFTEQVDIKCTRRPVNCTDNIGLGYDKALSFEEMASFIHSSEIAFCAQVKLVISS